MSKEANVITVDDIEQKIQEKMEQYEQGNNIYARIRLEELNMLMGWITCGDNY